MEAAKIAQICHEANRAYCETIGDTSQIPWDMAPEWQKKSAVNGVNFVIANPQAHESTNHENWLREKVADGWKYGTVKDHDKKEHPCIVPYDQLPTEQQRKDKLFRYIVLSLASALV